MLKKKEKMFHKNHTNKAIYSILFTLFCFSTTNTHWYSKFDPQKAKIFLKQFIEKDDLVFDVGANIGNKTDLYLQCGAKVICFEPQEKCLYHLYKKYENNSNVVIISKGLSDKPGHVDFFPCNEVTTIATCSRDWTTDGRFVQQGYSWNKPIKIEVTTLDKIIKKYGIPKFCKIDVEGFEYEVLKGLSMPIPYLSFEFTYERKLEAKKCLDYLTKLGYKKFNFAVGETSYFQFKQWLSADKLLQKIYSENKCGDDLWGDIYARY